jgi:putative transposase
VFALRSADTGVTVAEVCRKMGISEATYYNWKKKYGSLGVPERWAGLLMPDSLRTCLAL